jgi:DNA-binding PadR family transcriptional regulator
MSIERPLSPLELTALGIILKRGRCLAHAVVSEFAGSHTFAYRSGAGSIYPLLKRLAEAGLLRYSDRMYSLTDDGVEALRAWLRPPFDSAAFSTNLDVIRSRTYFLRLLSDEERSKFLDSAIEGLKGVLEGCFVSLAAQRASGDRFGELAMLGAVRETEARIAWLHEIREALEVPLAGI